MTIFSVSPNNGFMMKAAAVVVEALHYGQDVIPQVAVPREGQVGLISRRLVANRRAPHPRNPLNGDQARSSIVSYVKGREAQ